MMFLIYSPRKLTWVLIVICIIAVVHIWYMNHAVEVGSFVSQDKLGLFEFSFVNYHVLLWNDFKELKNLECDVYSTCSFKTRNDVTNQYNIFDAVVFNEDVLNSTYRPSERWDNQIYVFLSLAPTGNGPACKVYNDLFFNWTFTYRFDSTLVWNPFMVWHIESREIVAPNPSVIWKTNNEHVNARVELILNKKTKALAWIITNCNWEDHPYSYITALQDHMNRLGLVIDIFSNCTQRHTSHQYLPESSKLNEVIEKYHFLIVFEDHPTICHVSAKILLAYKNYAVPVVYGAANYSRYLPPGSYLNIKEKEMDAYSLACMMKQGVDDPAFYEGFFNWTNLYEFSAYPPERNPLCELCDALIKDKYSRFKTTIPNFRQWWNTPEGIEACNETGPN